jgi:hypothetical protein
MDLDLIVTALKIAGALYVGGRIAWWILTDPVGFELALTILYRRP